jgi:transposase
MREYTGKIVYLGIDVHKNTYSVTAICDNEIIKRDTIQAKPETLLKYCKRFTGAKIHSVYEAGFCGFSLHRFLIKNGVLNIVVHPPSIETEANVRSKTDKRDSKKMAIQLSAGRLKGIHVPSEKREQFQALTRLREKLVRDKTRTGSQLKMLLHKFGLFSLVEDRLISKKWLDKVLNLKLAEPLKYSVNEHVVMWRYLNERIKLINAEIKKQAVEDYAIERIYRSGPAIGPTFARIFANELGDMSQFFSEDALYSYVGFTPKEHSSGEHIRLGHITRQGKSIFRKMLVEIAWKAIYVDPTLMNVFERISKHSGKKRAIVAVGKRIIGKLRACFRKNELYKCGEEKLIL